MVSVKIVNLRSVDSADNPEWHSTPRHVVGNSRAVISPVIAKRPRVASSADKKEIKQRRIIRRKLQRLHGDSGVTERSLWNGIKKTPGKNGQVYGQIYFTVSDCTPIAVSWIQIAGRNWGLGLTGVPVTVAFYQLKSFADPLCRWTSR